jgi:hypothetical protein
MKRQPTRPVPNTTSLAFDRDWLAAELSLPLSCWTSTVNGSLGMVAESQLHESTICRDRGCLSTLSGLCGIQDEDIESFGRSVFAATPAVKPPPSDDRCAAKKCIQLHFASGSSTSNANISQAKEVDQKALRVSAEQNQESSPSVTEMPELQKAARNPTRTARSASGGERAASGSSPAMLRSRSASCLSKLPIITEEIDRPMAAPNRMKVANNAAVSAFDLGFAEMNLALHLAPHYFIRRHPYRSVTYRATTSPTIAVATETVVSVANAERAIASHSTFQ